MVLGEDIEEMVMQGYKAGIYEEGKELDNISAKLERYEARLGDVIWQILIKNKSDYEDGLDEREKRIISTVSVEMLYGSVAELLYDYSVLSDDVAERYDFGMLEDSTGMISLYLGASLTVCYPFCLLLLSACASRAETDYAAAIMVDGEIYCKTVTAMPAEIDESAILGYTESYTDEFPKCGLNEQSGMILAGSAIYIALEFSFIGGSILLSGDFRDKVRGEIIF